MTGGPQLVCAWKPVRAVGPDRRKISKEQGHDFTEALEHPGAGAGAAGIGRKKNRIASKLWIW